MKKTFKFKIGVLLMIVSVVAFLAIPVVPFLSLEKGTKIGLSTALLVFGEVTFWSGGILMGKELFDKYKSLLNPKNWKKTETESEEGEEPK